MHLFIDVNIFLGFYEATSDSLLELEKLITVLKQKKRAKLWLPDQVKREFWKNRDGSVASVLKEFSKLNGLGSIPRLVELPPKCRRHGESSPFRPRSALGTSRFS